MGSSKKHKEKRDKKKHKKARSRSRSYERDSHKRSHKSSQKDRERRRSRERYVDEASSSKTSEKKRFDDNRPENRRDSEPCPNELAALALKYSEKKRTLTRESENLPRTVIGSRSSDLSDEDFDIDRLLEDKLSENPEFASRKFPIRKRVSEGNNQSLVVQINNERKRPYVDSEDSLEKFATEQFFEEHGIPLENLSEQGQSIVIRRNFSPQQEFSHFSEEYESDISHNRSYSISQSSERNYEDLPGSGTKEKDGPLPPKRIKIKEEPKDYGSSHQQNVKENEEASSLIGGNSGQSQLSLSIADANKLRAKLGLKPLNIPEAIPGLGSGDAENEPSETATKEVFVKTENISEQKKAEKLREKLSTMKEKRKITEKLRKVKPLAESDSEDDSAANWVKKSRKLEKEKEQAEKTAKLLEEMDAEFGVGALMEEEFEKKKAYTSRDLRGLTVGHDSGVFKEGRHVILTLKDKDVLNEDDDVLQNVNLLDEERYAKNIENKKKKPAYRPYDEPEFDEFGILKKQTLLSKYDEEIEGAKKKTFTLGSNTYRDKEKEIEMIRMKLKQQQGVSLEMTNVRVASEYYTPDEMVQFKKPKKKVRKVRKREMLKADDLLSDLTELPERDFGTRNSAVLIDKEREDQFLYGDTATSVPAVVEMKEVEEEDDIVIPEDLSGIVVDEDHAEKELHLALHKARKLKQRKTLTVPEKVIETIKNANAEEMDTKEAGKAGSIVLNSTAEFCRTLGDIPTYGMSGNRDEEADELIDFERELMEERQRQEMEAQNRGAWNEVDIDEKPAEIVIRENEPILEEEPDISLGVAGALTLAKKKGYLDKDTKKLSGAPRTSTLQAQSYTIEEKFYEDDKFGKRDRYTGPIQDFREKGAYRPDVKLEYIDDSGRLLTAKEAFRYLSHKFHGKGPGKNKVDKRMKKLDQDTRLKQMSSTDTPLNTVKLLQAKQKETQSPYIVLSGGSRTLTQTMISKTKPT